MFAFFPASGFGWVFVSILFVLLLVAARIDFQTFRIPKPIVFAILVSGVFANLIRGVWMGIQGHGIFLFSESNGWLGLLDGILFSFIGFLCAFALLFVFWILGTCGGGDVKLMAALGAWLGPLLVLYVWFASVLVVVVIGVGMLALALLSGKGLRPVGKQKTPDPSKPPQWRLSYSLPVAIATACVLLWVCRADLGLVSPEPEPKGHTHAR